MLLHCRHDFACGCRHLVRGYGWSRSSWGLQDGVEHAAEVMLAAEHLDDFGVPDGALLGEGSGFVFGVPGLQGCLLR